MSLSPLFGAHWRLLCFGNLLVSKCGLLGPRAREKFLLPSETSLFIIQIWLHKVCEFNFRYFLKNNFVELRSDRAFRFSHHKQSDFHMI